MTETQFVEILRTTGARVFLVGGCVRDALRGVAAADRDYVVSGIEEAAFQRLFPKAPRVGRSFPVYLVEIDGRASEVAFARRERKVGAGYRGFDVAFSPDVTIEEDLYRRDTTMNSMARELPGGTLLDPYGGQADVRKHVVRAVSHHFMEDPVRALRAARQAALFEFTITDDTLEYMHACRDELRDEPSERVLGELERALAARRPSHFFRYLHAAGLLDVTFPELYALIGKTRPAAFHPEGDAFEHTMLIVDKVAAETEDVLVRFCGLAHDIGKGVTPKSMLPHHYGHEIAGGDVLAAWAARMRFPKTWRQAAAFVIREHMRAARLTKAGKIAKLLLHVAKSPLGFDGFNAVIRADHGSLPPYLLHGRAWATELQKISGHDAPTALSGSAIGDWVFAQQVQRLRVLMKA